MDNANPALFYFWAHGTAGDNYNPYDELDTPTLHGLVEKADTIFIEFISPHSDFQGTRELERDVNEYVKTGKMPLKLKMAYDHQMRVQGEPTIEFFIANLLQRTTKRIVLEKTLKASFDYYEEDHQVNLMFFESSLERAIDARKRFLEVGEKYQERRDHDVAEQIKTIPEMTLVLFGAGHPDIEKQVAAERPTEIHFPYPDYPLSFETKLRMAYRETGEVDQELFLRKHAEVMARAGIWARLGRSITSREIDLLSHHYAAALSTDQILSFRDYIISCRRMLAGISAGDIVESYFKRERLSLMEEVLVELRR